MTRFGRYLTTIVCALLLGGLAGGTAALADTGGHDHGSMPGMDMRDDHDSMPGMDMTGEDHDSMPGMDMPGMVHEHGPTGPSDHQRTAVLTAFALLNGGVLVSAAVVRRQRPRRRRA